jgi:Transposase IS116/IS110/IS902 family
LLSLKKQILDFDRMILAWHRSDQTSKRLNCIPGVGPLLATALVSSVADPKAFRSGRNFSAWIGLVPKQHSSGGRPRLGSISKQGDRYLRSLFVAGALAVIRYAKIHGTKYRPWVAALLARRLAKVAAIALANELARMGWAMMARGTGQCLGAVEVEARENPSGLAAANSPAASRSRIYVSSCDCCTGSNQPVAIGRGPYTSTHGPKCEVSPRPAFSRYRRRRRDANIAFR